MRSIISTKFAPLPGRRNALTKLAGIAAGVGSGLAPLSSFGQGHDDYPNASKLVRIVVPFPAGMGSDNIARVLAQAITEVTGSTVIVENKPGGNNVISVKYLNSLKPDGYGLFLASQSPTSVNAVLYRSLGYDPVKDLKPVALMLKTKWILVSSAASPHKTLQAFIAAAKESGATVAASGGSSSYQLGLQLLGKAAGIPMNVVPYNGTPQAVNDVIGGQVSLSLLDVSTAGPFITGGRVIPLVVVGNERFAKYPDVPCSAELQLAMPPLSSWNGIFASADTPYDLRVRMSSMIRDVVMSPRVQEWITGQGGESTYGNVDEMAAMQLDQIAMYRRAMEIGNIPLQ